MKCHQCAACCTEISISSPVPGMPQGKLAGVRCVNLRENLCSLFGKSERPAICSSFQADADICGSNHNEAVQRIRWYEKETS